MTERIPPVTMDPKDTAVQYESAVQKCRQIFINKNLDYGNSWHVLRTTSLTDQLFIKAQRIRTIEEKGIQMVEDPVENEYPGLVNYCVMALIQLDKRPPEEKLSAQDIAGLFEAKIGLARELMEKKNHDYGEAWRDMRISSFTDMILMKLLRIRQIEQNQGRTINSEGVAANYLDIINYALFALIKLEENESAGEVN